MARAELPTLQEHLVRIQGYLRGCGLLAFPSSETPLRRKLAEVMEAHGDEAVRLWTESIGAALQIEDEELETLAQDMLVAQSRWLAHIRNPDEVETYAVLREHARGGFIAKYPPSRFLAAQLKVRQIVVALLQREMRDSPALPELLGLLDQEFWERVLHITDFFVEAREQDLAAQHERYRRSVDSAPAILFLVGTEDGVISGSNLVAERELGGPARALMGSQLWELHLEREREIVREIFDETVRRGSSSKENLHLVREGREPLPVDLRTTLIEYGEDRIVQAMYVDLSERRRLEFQLIQSEKMAAIGQLAAGIAHEIRNPLGIIMNALYDLAELLTNPGPEVREDLQIARVEMERVQEIINNLLEFSRDSQTELQAVDLNALIGRTLKLMNKYLQNNSVRARAVLAPSAVCNASENGMRQVLLNLITNAAQAMPEGGELKVVTEVRPGDRVGLTVTDTGVGISPERLGKIFDPFYTTKDPGEGTGLGLSVVHSVITNAGGTIEVKSSPGNGTSFSIELPAASDGSGRPIEPVASSLRGT